MSDVSPVHARPVPGVDPLAYKLMAHYAPMPRYKWVLRTAGVYATVEYPTVDEVNAASEAYDRPTTVSQAVADALTAAGYGAQIT